MAKIVLSASWNETIYIPLFSFFRQNIVPWKERYKPDKAFIESARGHPRNKRNKRIEMRREDGVKRSLRSNRSKTFSFWRYKRSSFIMGRIERGKRGVTRELTAAGRSLYDRLGAMFPLIDFLLGDETFRLDFWGREFSRGCDGMRTLRHLTVHKSRK